MSNYSLIGYCTVSLLNRLDPRTVENIFLGDRTAAAQLLRWHQRNANNKVYIEGHKGLLTEGFTVISPTVNADVRGRHKFSVQRPPPDSQNAHDLLNVVVALGDEEWHGLKAEIVHVKMFEPPLCREHTNIKEASCG